MLKTYYVPSTESTQEVAKRWVHIHDHTYHAVFTDHQTQGRGRHDSQWYDEPGSSLLVSYVLWDQPLLQPVGITGLLIAAATAQALETAQPDLPSVYIKYPNDLILTNRKVGGILIEVVNEVAVVGIGINLTQKSFPEPLKDSAISLKQVLGTNLVMPDLRDTLIHLIWGLIHEGFDHFRQGADSLWQVCLQRDGTHGRKYRILDLPGHPEGIALCLEPDFRLCLQLPDGSMHRTYYVESV